MKKFALLALALVMTLCCTLAQGEISMSKKELYKNAALDKNVTNILVMLQDGDVTDTMMIASVNGRTGRSVMTRLDCGMTVPVAGGEAALGEVYMMGDEKSRGVLAMHTVNTLLDLNIATYVALDVTRLPELAAVMGTLNMQFDQAEADALDRWTGINELTGDEILTYVRLKLESDSPSRSRGYDALMQLLYQGLHSGDVMGMMGLGSKLLASMDTNLNAMAAVTMVSAVQGGSDRREVLVAQGSPATAEEARALVHREIYE